LPSSFATIVPGAPAITSTWLASIMFQPYGQSGMSVPV
jgi:hypothetical protein